MAFSSTNPMNVFPQAYIDKVTADTLEGNVVFFRDANMSQETLRMYKRGLVIQETGFFDATTLEGGLAAQVRYNIYTSQTETIAQGFAKYKCWTFQPGSFFKVLDLYGKEHRSLVTLLQIPAYTVPYFALNSHPQEAALVADSRDRYDAMQGMPIGASLGDHYWLKRTAFPLGINDDGTYFYRFDYGDQPSLDPLYEPKSFFKRLFKR
jgi:hypothetical protein